MSQPPAPRSHQIDVVGQVGAAYRAVFERVQLVGEMGLLPFLVIILISLGQRLLVGSRLGMTPAAVMAASAGDFMLSALVSLVAVIAIFLVFSVFVVRWHRFILLGEAVSGELIPPGWREFVIVGIKLGAIAFGCWVVLVVIALLPPYFLTVPLAALGGVALTLAALRVSLVFPAAAIEQPMPLRTAWDWIDGNFWRFFACCFASYLPFIVLQIVVGMLGGAFPSLFWIVFEALRLAIAFAGAAVIATLLSHIYREIAPA